MIRKGLGRENHQQSDIRVGVAARQENCGKNAEPNLLGEEVQAVKSSSNLGLVQPELQGFRPQVR